MANANLKWWNLHNLFDFLGMRNTVAFDSIFGRELGVFVAERQGLQILDKAMKTGGREAFELALIRNWSILDDGLRRQLVEKEMLRLCKQDFDAEAIALETIRCKLDAVASHLNLVAIEPTWNEKTKRLQIRQNRDQAFRLLQIAGTSNGMFKEGSALPEVWAECRDLAVEKLGLSEGACKLLVSLITEKEEIIERRAAAKAAAKAAKEEAAAQAAAEAEAAEVAAKAQAEADAAAAAAEAEAQAEATADADAAYDAWAKEGVGLDTDSEEYLVWAAKDPRKSVEEEPSAVGTVALQAPPTAEA